MAVGRIADTTYRGDSAACEVLVEIQLELQSRMALYNARLGCGGDVCKSNAWRQAVKCPESRMHITWTILIYSPD